MTDNATRLAHCFATVFPQLTPQQISEATTDTVASWDSVANLTLLSVVGEEFGVEVDLDRFEDLNSFRGILDYLEKAQQT